MAGQAKRCQAPGTLHSPSAPKEKNDGVIGVHHRALTWAMAKPENLQLQTLCARCPHTLVRLMPVRSDSLHSHDRDVVLNPYIPRPSATVLSLFVDESSGTGFAFHKVREAVILTKGRDELESRDLATPPSTNLDDRSTRSAACTDAR